MVNFCVVYGCSNRSNREKDRSFFRIPAIIYHSDEKTKNLSQARRRKWLSMIQREDLTDSQIVNSRVCSDHFKSGKPSALYDTSNFDWFPTLKIGSNADGRYKKGKYSRLKQKGEKRKRTETTETLVELSNPTEQTQHIKQEEQECHFKSCEIMTCVTMSDMERLERENFHLREENRSLSSKLRILMHLVMMSMNEKTRETILENQLSEQHD